MGYYLSGGGGPTNSATGVGGLAGGTGAGPRDARLLDDARGIDWSWFEGVERVGVTAGASAPEDLVQGVIDAIAARYDVTIAELVEARETVTFKLPRLLLS